MYNRERMWKTKYVGRFFRPPCFSMNTYDDILDTIWMLFFIGLLLHKTKLSAQMEFFKEFINLYADKLICEYTPKFPKFALNF
jgi:hypothetical protein